MNINISNASGEPIYLQIASQIKTMILERQGFIESYTGKGSFVKAQNLELFREEQLKQIEALLAEAGQKAQQCGVTMEELHELLDLVNGGE